MTPMSPSVVLMSYSGDPVKSMLTEEYGVVVMRYRGLSLMVEGEMQENIPRGSNRNMGIEGDIYLVRVDLLLLKGW